MEDQHHEPRALDEFSGTSNPETKLDINGELPALALTDNQSGTQLRLFTSGAGYLQTQNNYPLYLGVNNGPPSIVLATNGRVGIGTTNPTDKVHIAAPGIAALALTGEGSSGSLRGGTVTGREGGVSSGGVIALHTHDDAGVMQERMRIDHLGLVGIGTVAPGYRLDVSSSGDNDVLRLQDVSGWCIVYPAGMLGSTCTSDQRLKTEIKDAAPILDYLLGLRIRSYTVKANGAKAIGVIAQELKERYPELVSLDSSGYYSVREIGTWEIVKALQELHLEHEALKAELGRKNTRIAEFEQKTAGLETRVAELGQRVVRLEEQRGPIAAASFSLEYLWATLVVAGVVAWSMSRLRGDRHHPPR